MWMVAYTPGQEHWLTIDFGKEVNIAGLRFHNYNKRPEDTNRGAKLVTVVLDNTMLSPPSGYVLRQAPGHCAYDFGQTLRFTQTNISSQTSSMGIKAAKYGVVTKEERQALESAMPFYFGSIEPSGMLVTINLLSTWGDLFYIGLNGIELLDPAGNTLPVPANIHAVPPDINILDGVSNDPRVAVSTRVLPLMH